MPKNPKSPRSRDCKVCYGPHHDETHEATLRVRGWFHHQVTRHLDEDFDTGQGEEAEELAS